MLSVKDVDAEYLALYDQRLLPRDLARPSGVRRVGKTIFFELPGKTPLSLTDFLYKGKDDSGDSQLFSYLKETEKYHVVVVAFGHDRPCFLLVEKTSLQVYFVDY